MRHFPPLPFVRSLTVAPALALLALALATPQAPAGFGFQLRIPIPRCEPEGNCPTPSPLPSPQARRQLSEPAVERAALETSHGRLRVPPWQTAARLTRRSGSTFSRGSGTVVLVREKEFVIVTCAHIFRTPGPSEVEVETFGPNLRGNSLADPVKSAGKRLAIDFERDVALVLVENSDPNRPASPIAPKSAVPSPNAELLAIGCSAGRDPTVWPVRFKQAIASSGITFLTDFPPVPGRSGGGLFDGRGRLVGVCSWTNEVDTGGYSGLPNVWSILETAALADDVATENEPAVAHPRERPTPEPRYAPAPPPPPLASRSYKDWLPDESPIDLGWIVAILAGAYAWATRRNAGKAIPEPKASQVPPNSGLNHNDRLADLATQLAGVIRAKQEAERSRAEGREIVDRLKAAILPTSGANAPASVPT